MSIKHTILCSILFFSFVFLNVSPALASIDSRCMTQEDCTTLRTQINTADSSPDDAFITRDESSEVARSCPETMVGIDGDTHPAGFCLPTQAAETKIAIGGKTTFLSLAEYIAYIYRYSMFVAGALCVILFIVAGLEWTLSGGDGSKIDEAKTRISNAITGLILMATSYVILYTIDPNLTSLKPPEIYLIRGVNSFDLYCSNIPNKSMPLGLYGAVNNQNTPKISYEAAEFSYLPNTALCGFEYHISASEGQQCAGSFCTPANGQTYTCGQQTSTSTPSCIPGNIVGRIYGKSFWEAMLNDTAADRLIVTTGRLLIGDGWQFPWISGSGNGNINLYAICENGETQQVRNQSTVTQDTPDKSVFYNISITEADLDTAKNNCPNQIIRGYAAWFDFNELGFSDVAGETGWTTRAGAGCIVGGTFGGLIGCGAGAVVALGAPLLEIDEGHYIGRQGTEGVDIMDEGDVSKMCYFSGIPETHLLLKEDLLRGVQINIDVQKIADIDNDVTDRKKAYGSTYTSCRDIVDENKIKCSQGDQSACAICGSECATINNIGPKF